VSNMLIYPYSHRRRHGFLKVPETLVEFGGNEIEVKPLSAYHGEPGSAVTEPHDCLETPSPATNQPLESARDYTGIAPSTTLNLRSSPHRR
jgi:hypothetical protein